MASPHVSESFGDLLDVRFQKIFHEQYSQLPDMLAELYTFEGDNGRNDTRWSQVGAAGDWTEFTGKVSYDSLSQGYDTVATQREYTSGIKVERKLFDWDQYSIMDQRPRALATSANRTRQVHGASLLNGAFSVDTSFYNNSEAVALCSNSHTTEASGVSTATGFDNLGTDAISATALATARINMVDFRDDRGNRMSIVPDEIYHPPGLYEQAFEIVSSMGKVDTATNNRNVHEGAYRLVEWNYMTDANNWFVSDSTMRKMMVFWVDQVAVEFAFAEDLDTLVAKWRGYMRATHAHTDWRWVFGFSVS